VNHRASLGVFALLRHDHTPGAGAHGVASSVARRCAPAEPSEFGWTVAASVTLPLFCREP
jgi:hypothetical protein